MLIVFGLSIFLGASLLFVLQPMVARSVLPMLGGSPAVWNTCMLFFQASLLAGYGYAYFLSRLRSSRRQWFVHGAILLVALIFLPVGPPVGWVPSGHGSPVWWLLGALTVGVGMPFVALASASPLLQSWFSRTQHPAARDPYFLYAASNAGSLLALPAYLLIVEPQLGLLEQQRLWSWGFGAFCLLALGSGLFAWRHWERAPMASHEESAAPSLLRRSRWVLAAAVPSSLMLGVTHHLSTDIAAVPLLWVVVLMLYLFTYVVAFSRFGPKATAAALWLLPPAIVFLSVMLLIDFERAAVLQIAVHLGGLVVIGVACHGRLAADRPPPTRLTEYYLWIAFGGVLGGVFNSLLAPVLFDRIAEYPIALLVACLFGPGSGVKNRSFRLFDFVLPAIVAAIYFAMPTLLENREIDGNLGHVPWEDLLRIGVPAVVALCLVGWRLRFTLAMSVLLLAPLWETSLDRTPVYQSRTFFGVHRVMERQAGRALWHRLYHGTTKHGEQSDLPGAEYVPTTYFTQRGPLGDVMKTLATKDGPRRIAVVGLGAGTIAAYGRSDWKMTFYEIDPEVERIARNSDWFTFLKESRSPVDVILGDARLKLADAAGGSFDLIVLDAFSSDAIPVHLLTREAMTLYIEKLAEGGILALHLSNRYFALERIASAIAADLDLVAQLRNDERPDHGRRQAGVASTWVVVARESGDLGPIDSDPKWEWLEPNSRFPLWTDDHLDLLSVWDR